MDVAVGVAVVVGVAVGVEVEQTQLDSEVQDAFLQNPLVAPAAIEQVRSEGQSLLVEQAVLHSGTGVEVGVMVNESEQAAGFGVGLASWALGMLDGTFGATGCCLN